jgi:CO dehydrogenase maturation factor
VIDAEAGIEQVNRKVMATVNALVLVSDVSAKGIRVAETIKKVAKKVTHTDAIGLLINRARSEKEVSQIRSRTKLRIIGSIPEDETIRKFDSSELSFLSLPECPAYKAVVKAFEKVIL